MCAMHCPLKLSQGPPLVAERHQTENPRQVTDAPVSMRPRTGMPSRVSWSVMGGLTAHTTGVILALGDPPRSSNAPGRSGRRLGCHLLVSAF